jgi:hypothetical protein
MKKLKSLFLLAGAVTALNVAMPQVQAQGGPRSPEEFRQMRLDRLKEDLGVTKDDEWKIISERADAVMKAQTAAMAGRGGFGRGGFGGGRRGGPNADAGAGNGGGNGGGQNRRGGGGGFPGMEQPQEVKDLQSAIEAKAPADEIKAKLEKVRAYRKSKEADLTKAQEKLKEVLDSRQEAIAVMAGLLQ